MNARRFFLSVIIVVSLASSAFAGKGADKETLKYWFGRSFQVVGATYLVLYFARGFANDYDRKGGLQKVLLEIMRGGGAVILGQLLVKS